MRYIYNGVGPHCSPNINNTMYKMPMPHHTIRIQRFGHTWLTKQYKYNGLNVYRLLSVTYTTVWGHMTHQTLHMQWSEGLQLTKHNVYNGLETHGHQTWQVQWCDCPWLTKRYTYNGGGPCLLLSCVRVWSTTRVLLAQGIQRWSYEP